MSGAPPPGTILAGKYRVDSVLGEGGMGVVVRAHHEVLQQSVALKFLTGAAATNGDSVERFLREARAAVKIQSEHIARIVDVGTLESGSPFMVMELLEGSDLSDLVHTNGPMHIEQAVDCVLQALDAIAEAHALGIIHRDLKPSNLFLASRADGTDVVKVLDFGISKVTFADESSKQASLTATQAVMGSPLYMSPEQFRSAKKVDPRSDLWSLGVILYELLVGKPPFDGESMGEVFAAVLENEPASIRASRPDVPPPLEQAVMRCLRKSPNDRFADAGELARALAPFGSGRAKKCVDRASNLATRSSGAKLPPSSPSLAMLPMVPGATQTGGAPHEMAPIKSPVAQTANTTSPWSDAPGASAARKPLNKAALFLGGVGAVLSLGAAVLIAMLVTRKPTSHAVTAESSSVVATDVVALPPLADAGSTTVDVPTNVATATLGTVAPVTTSTSARPATGVSAGSKPGVGSLPGVGGAKPHATATTKPPESATVPAVTTPPKPSGKPGSVDFGRL